MYQDDTQQFAFAYLQYCGLCSQWNENGRGESVISAEVTDLEEADVQHDGLVVVDGLISKRVRRIPKTRCPLRFVVQSFRCTTIRTYSENAEGGCMRRFAPADKLLKLHVHSSKPSFNVPQRSTTEISLTPCSICSNS